MLHSCIIPQLFYTYKSSQAKFLSKRLLNPCVVLVCLKLLPLIKRQLDETTFKPRSSLLRETTPAETAGSYLYFVARFRPRPLTSTFFSRTAAKVKVTDVKVTSKYLIDSSTRPDGDYARPWTGKLSLTGTHTRTRIS